MKADVCCWLASLWWVALDYTWTTHRCRNSPVQSQLLNCLWAARKPCFHMCWQQALSSGMLTPVVSWSYLVRFPSALCCTQCSNHSSAWGPGVQQWCTHYGFLHQPEVSVANGLLYAISIFCLSKVWKSHICYNYGA